MNVATTGSIARELKVDRDRVIYAVRKLGLKPLGFAGPARLFPPDTTKAVREFLNRKPRKESKS